MLPWMIAKSLARSGIHRDRDTCSAEQLHIRRNATATHRSAKNEMGMIQVENDRNRDLYAILFLVHLGPNASTIKRAGVGLQVVEVELLELRQGDRNGRRNAAEAGNLTLKSSRC